MMREGASVQEIGAVVEKVATWNPRQEGGGCAFSYIDIGSVSQSEKRVVAAANVNATEAPSRARQKVRAGDVLVSTVRPNLNAVAIVPDELDGATASTGFCVLRSDSVRLNSRYLFHWVRTPQFIREMVRRATGANYPAVSDRIIKSSFIPLLPIDEQKRIAAILDKADAIRRKRQRAIALTEDLLRSTFLEMFGDPVLNPKGWDLVSCESVAERLTVGIVVRPASYYQESGVPALRSLNVRANKIETEPLVYVSPEDNETKLRKTRVWKDDVLVVRSGQPGTAAVVPGELDGVNAIDILILTPNQEVIHPVFLCSYFNSPGGKRMALGEQRGQIQKHLNVRSLKSAPIPLPPLALQQRFAVAAKGGEHLAAVQGAHMDGVGDLFGSLSQRAFRGEL